MEQGKAEQEEAGRKIVGGARVKAMADPPRKVKQWVRTIGIADSPESQSVNRVNADIANLLNQGWTLHTVRPIGSGVGGSVVVYYLFIK